MVLWTLAQRSIARLWPMLLAVSGVLLVFQLILVLVAVTFEDTKSFDLLATLVPLSLQRSLGGGFLTLASFSGIVTFGYVHPVVVLTFVLFAAYVGTEPAGEVESQLFDIQLSRPVSRSSIAARTLLLVFGGAVAIAIAMNVTTFLALWGFAPRDADWPALSTVANLALHLVLLAWGIGTLGLLAASVARRRASALGAVAVLTVALYLVNAVADIWRPAQYLHWLSPFGYFPGLALAGGAPPRPRDLAALAVPTACLAMAAFWLFQRRDL